MLLKLVKQHGVRKWSQIAKNLEGRIGKQCRERWHNHLRPDIKVQFNINLYNQLQLFNSIRSFGFIFNFINKSYDNDFVNDIIFSILVIYKPNTNTTYPDITQTTPV
jgi:Myb-like DNA-binding domain